MSTAAPGPYFLSRSISYRRELPIIENGLNDFVVWVESLMNSSDLPKLAVVFAPHGAAGLRDLMRARSGLCSVVLVIPEDVAAAHPDVIKAARRLFNVVVCDQSQVTEVIAALDVNGLTTFSDELLDLTDCAARELRLPSSGTVHAWDKYMQRKAFAECGLTRVSHSPVDTRESVWAAIADVGLPCALKPRRGHSGAGIAFLRDDRDVAWQIAHRRVWTGLMLESMLPAGRHPAVDWLADFVSVETVSSARDRHHVAVFDKLPIEVTPRAGPEGSDVVSVTGDVFPTQLPARLAAEVKDYVGACLNVLDVRWRVTHTEVKLTPYGPEIIEINGRVGGHLNRLLRLAGGVDLVEMSMSVSMGLRPRPRAVPNPAHRYVAGYFPPFTPRHEVVASRVEPQDLRTLPGVVGVDEVAGHGRPQAEKEYRMVNLTLTAETPNQLCTRITEVRRRVESLFADDLSMTGRVHSNVAAMT